MDFQPLWTGFAVGFVLGIIIGIGGLAGVLVFINSPGGDHGQN